MINPNPIIYNTSSSSSYNYSTQDLDSSVYEPIDQPEVFDMIRHINDPEHPLTLEQLNVAQLARIQVDGTHISIQFTPTVPHCSMATLIGLCIRAKLLRSLPKPYKVDVSVTPGTHMSEQAVNKQLADKERVAAAMENSALVNVVNRCIANTD
jgi:metal-sulfur cluster biosynthetic enzyme